MLTLAQATAILSVLMAFGVDTSVLENIRAILIPAPVVQPTPVLGAAQQVPQPLPVIQPVMTPAPIEQPVPTPAPVLPTISSIGIDGGILHVTTFDQIDIAATGLPEGVSLGAMQFSDRPTLVNRNGKVTRDGHGYGVKLDGLPAEFSEIDVTIKSLSGGLLTQHVVVR